MLMFCARNIGRHITMGLDQKSTVTDALLTRCSRTVAL